MFEVGRLCVKTAGRDATRRCLVVEVLDNSYVLIDGQTRRRKCNINHLEATDTLVKLSKSATSSAVAKELEALGYPVDKKGEVKKPSEKPIPKRVLEAAKKQEEKVKEAEKKAAKKVKAKK